MSSELSRNDRTTAPGAAIDVRLWAEPRQTMRENEVWKATRGLYLCCISSPNTVAIGGC